MFLVFFLREVLKIISSKYTVLTILSANELINLLINLDNKVDYIDENLCTDEQETEVLCNYRNVKLKIYSDVYIRQLKNMTYIYIEKKTKQNGTVKN